MSTAFFPEADALIQEDEPGVTVTETESALAVEFEVPAGELAEFSIQVFDYLVVVTCERGETSFRRQFALPVDAYTRGITCGLGESVLAIRVTKRPKRRANGHMPGFNPDAPAC